MAVMKTCFICGKPYEACHSELKATDTFFWQDVACSEKCGTEYLNRALAERSKNRATSGYVSGYVAVVDDDDGDIEPPETESYSSYEDDGDEEIE